jgi:hypothetical protein
MVVILFKLQLTGLNLIHYIKTISNFETGMARPHTVDGIYWTMCGF